jgi:hypothetical protein
MSTRKQAVSSPARVYARLHADDALLPGEASAVRRSGALFLAMLVLTAVPLFMAANAAGLIGDVPTAVAKSGSGLSDDDDSSGPGGDDDDDDDTVTKLGTDDTSQNGNSTRGTTNDNDTVTKLGTDDTSHNGDSTRGTTNDNDTNTRTGAQTRGATNTATLG